MTTTTRNKKTTKRKFFIPPFYEFNPQSLGKDNYKFVLNGQELRLYVTPLIRTILENISTLNVKGQESLARTIKEKLDSNSRLLLKKGLQNSKSIKINDREFVLVNVRLNRVSSTCIQVMNDMSTYQTREI
jgi:hypothetical protein